MATGGAAGPRGLRGAISFGLSAQGWEMGDRRQALGHPLPGNGLFGFLWPILLIFTVHTSDKSSFPILPGSGW